jgi:hypothetical protein
MTRLAPLLLLLASCASTRGKPEVLFFVTPDCPIANRFAPEIKRIVAEYEFRGVAFSVIYTDGTPEAVRKHAAEYGYESGVRVDPGRVLAHQYGVTVTPEAVVVSQGARVYRGRIDDRYLAPGEYRLKPTTRDLRDALDAVLAGRPVAVAETKAAGCPLTD